MQKIYYYISSFLFIFISCNESNLTEPVEEEGVIIQLSLQQNIPTRIVDADNLASEQVINNISLFFTDPSSPTITHKFVYAGFTLSGDYQLITLPIQPEELLTKDIYAIANYNSEATLNGLSTLDNMRDLLTPAVDKTNNLTAGSGFCMSGSLAGFDFTDPSAYPATIPLIRTCAKFRVNLTFPENPGLSTTNSFLMQNAAKYTYVFSNATNVLPLTDYFNFAAATPLVDNGSRTYTNIVYVYEATKPALMTVYVTLNAFEEQEFTATLPIPLRNHLYDLNIQVYEEEETRAATSTIPKYRFKSQLSVYNEQGELVEELTL